MATEPAANGSAAQEAPAILIMARVPRRGEVRPALESLIGADHCVALQTTLLLQALEWARALAPREIYIAHEPADGGRELRALLGEGVTMFPQNGDGIAGRLADAVGRIYTHGRGPVVVVWPDLPQLRPEHALAALGDLAAGADVVLGPVFEGGFYLVGFTRPIPALFALPEKFWRGSDGIGMALAAGSDGRPLEVGILRPERGLHRPADVRAALADPLLPPAVARALGRR
jgi:glycosyltransferase A (GT-A) superfamily protein (DUF2064 family)